MHMSVLQWIFWIAFAVCVSFCTGFFFGWAYRGSKDKSLTRRVQVLKSRLEMMKTFCPRIKWPEDEAMPCPPPEENKADYLPKDLLAIEIAEKR